MSRRAASGAIAALCAGLALAGCAGGSHVRAMPGTVTDTAPRTASHSATHRYSARQVGEAFAAQGVRLRNVSPHGYRGVLAMLDGRPAHGVYVYVILKGCKCTLEQPFRKATVTRHGNVEVLWRPAAARAVHAALRRLD